MGEKNDMNVHLRLGPSYNESVLYREKMNNILTVIGVILTLLSAAGWIYLFHAKEETYATMRLDVLIVAGIVLAGSIIGIFFVGYDDRFMRNVVITMAVETVLAMIVFYLSGLEILARQADMEPSAMFRFLEFFIYLLCAVVLTLLPAVLTSLLTWVIMKLFGRAA